MLLLFYFCHKMKEPSRPMRILLLTYQGDTAGSTNSIAYLSKGMADKGHKVYVGCRRESLLHAMLSNTTVNLIPMTFTRKIDPSNMKQIRNAVREFNIQIINAQSSWDRYNSILARWIYRLPVKLVHTRRQNPRSIGGYFQNRFYVKGTDKIVVISDELKRIFVNAGIPAEHLQVIYNGIPAERFNVVNARRVEDLSKQFNLNDNDVVIGCVSRLKNQEQIIRALQYLDESYKVLLVGVPPGYFDDLVERLNIKNKILYAGIVIGDDVLNYYKLMNVNVLASTMDGFGLALLEAMALDVPVVATDFGGIKNVVRNGHNGLFFKDNDIKDLANKLNAVISDAELRKRLVANGRNTALQTFSIERTVDNYETFFESLL